MRRKICFGALLVFCTIFSALFAVYYDVEAFSFGTAYPITIYGGQVFGNKGGNSINFESYVSTNDVYEIVVSDGQGVDTDTYVSRIWFDIGQRSIPAGSLFTFTVRYRTSGGFYVPQGEYFGSNAILLNKNCTTIRESYNNQNGSYVLGDAYCSYWGYTSNQINSGFNLFMSMRYTFQQGYTQVVQIPVQINSVTILTESGGGGSSGLTPADQAFLQQQIGTITSGVSSNTSVLNQIKILIQSQAEDQQETLDNIQDAIEQQNEQDAQDREDIENQQTDISSDSTDSADDAESTGTTLLGAFSAFVTALTSASPTNCNIDMDLGNLDLGIVNLCQLSLPQPVPTIASILMILFFVPLSIATARKVINLFRSFQ